MIDNSEWVKTSRKILVFICLLCEFSYFESDSINKAGESKKVCKALTLMTKSKGHQSGPGAGERDRNIRNKCTFLTFQLPSALGKLNSIPFNEAVAELTPTGA